MYINICCHVNILTVEFFKFCAGWAIMQKIHVFGFRIEAVWTSVLCWGYWNISFRNVYQICNL